MELSNHDYHQLCLAKQLLEHPSLTARLSHYVGTPFEKSLELLPQRVNKKLFKVLQSTLMKLAQTAVLTLDDRQRDNKPSNKLHKVGAMVSGGVGGFFGLPGLTFELPISTLIMFRSIADIARSEGEQLADPQARLACLEVFALGGKSTQDDGSESGYFAVRTLLAKSLTDVSEHLAHKGLSQELSPALLALVEKIASRFGLQLSEKFAAQAMPFLGAAGGATLNTLFMQHFQAMAQGHFIVRRLEREYGADIVEAVYQQLPLHPR